MSNAKDKKKPQSSPTQPEKKDALTTTGPKALAKADLNQLLLQDEGAGSENITAKDCAIPRITILQALSPQCVKGQPEFIKGAEAGDFFNNISGTVWAKGEEGFHFIPVSYRRANIEWIPKSKGGGFIADHGADDSILSKTKKDEKTGAMLLPNGNEIVTTAEYFVIAIHNKTGERINAVISMAKTQLKKARKLNTAISGLLIDRPNGVGKFNPAMFYSAFDATSVPESNDKGSWMGWNLPRRCDTLELENGQELYLNARQFREVVSAGKVTVATPVEDHQAAGTPEDGATL